MSLPIEAWQITEPYTAEQKEQLVDCLYRYVELNVALTQIMKAFDRESRLTSIAFLSIEKFLHQNTSKTFDVSRRKEKESLPENNKDDGDKKKDNRKDKNNQLNDNRIFWFIDGEAYVQLGEEVMHMVGLLDAAETYVQFEIEGQQYVKCNYKPTTIDDRIRGINIGSDGTEDAIYERK